MNFYFGVILLLSANLMFVAEAGVTVRKPPMDIFDKLPMPSMPAVNFTFPGTKWCGIGNIPSNYSDLGIFNQTDICCRSHQQCEEIIEPVATLYTLDNPTLLPKFSCDCEMKLFKCLKEQDDVPSKVFGEAYFSVMKECFAKDYPVVECVKYQKAPIGNDKRCTAYKFDETQDKTYQYFDMPYYSYNLQ